MFYIVDPVDPNAVHYLAKMHNLRYKIFSENLKWVDGLQVFCQMEFDKYDHNKAKYLIHLNSQNDVDACARLTPSNEPYLLGHSFQDYITEETIPDTGTTFEISRLCADHKSAPRNITGQLMAAMLEYGLANNIQKYVSLSDIRIIPVVKRFGWLANKIGPLKDTGTEICVALSYDVSNEFYENVKRIVAVEQLIYELPVLPAGDPTFRNQLVPSFK